MQMSQTTPSDSAPEVVPDRAQVRRQSLSKEQPTRWQHLIPDTWTLECLLMIFTLGCFLAICSVLLAYDKKEWPDMAYGLSLNAIISILATASKSSLIHVAGEALKLSAN